MTPSTIQTSRHDPDEPRGWNWGAFLLNWIWGIGNNTFIALLAMIPFVGLVMVFVLGAKGNAWAWRNGRWDSLAHFRRVQRWWAIWGFVVWIGGAVLIGGGLGTFIYAFKNSEAYRLGIAKLESSTEAGNLLGRPITTGFPLGEINVAGSSGRATLNFSVSGPKAEGRASLEAVKQGGVWSLKRLRLQIDGRPTPIDLLQDLKAMRAARPPENG